MAIMETPWDQLDATYGDMLDSMRRFDRAFAGFPHFAAVRTPLWRPALLGAPNLPKAIADTTGAIRPFERSLFGPLVHQRFGELDKSFNIPRVDIKDTGTEVVVHADLPGMEKDDINLNVKNGILTISAERKEDHEEKKEDWILQERSQCKFYRSFALPTTVKEDGISASFNNGVLEVKIPKTEATPVNERAIKID